MLKRVLGAKVDNKTWHAILIGSILTTLGAEAIKTWGPALYGWADSRLAREGHFRITLRHKDTRQLVGGAEVAIRSEDDSAEIVRFRTDAEGVAQGRHPVRPGFYVLRVGAVYQGERFRSSDSFALGSDRRYVRSLELDPREWKEAQPPVAAETVSLPRASSDTVPSWFVVAQGELGVAETPGPERNPRVQAYLRTIGLANAPDEVDWSSAFVNWALESVGIKGIRSAVDRDWLNWGKAAPTTAIGCVAVFQRGGADATTTHAGFFVKEEEARLYVLGGNQRNSVSIAAFPRSRFLGCRVPK